MVDNPIASWLHPGSKTKQEGGPVWRRFRLKTKSAVLGRHISTRSFCLRLVGSTRAAKSVES